MQSNKISVIFIMSMLALSGIGITYAGWTDLISVSGTVETGTVEFEIVAYSGTWVWKDLNRHESIVHKSIVDTVDEDIDGILNDDPNGFYENPDYELVSRSYCYDNPNTADTVDFSYENLYPVNPPEPYCVDFVFSVGSIPVILNQQLTDFGWTTMSPSGWITANDWYWCIVDNNNNLIYSTVGTLGLGDIIQLHPDIEYTWKLCLTVQQIEETMGASAAGSGTLAIGQWSDTCDEVFDKGDLISLPDFAVSCTWSKSSGWYWTGNGHYYPHKSPIRETYLDADLSGIGPGYTPYIFDGVWPCFCVDEDTTFNPPITKLVRLYSTYDDSCPYGDLDDWEKVCYLVNTYFDPDDPNWDDVAMLKLQFAIWEFVDGGYYNVQHSPPGITYPDADVEAMITAANTYGDDFIPQTGQLIPVLLWPVNAQGQPVSMQKSIILVDP